MQAWRFTARPAGYDCEWRASCRAAACGCQLRSKHWWQGVTRFAELPALESRCAQAARSRWSASAATRSAPFWPSADFIRAGPRALARHVAAARRVLCRPDLAAVPDLLRGARDRRGDLLPARPLSPRDALHRRPGRRADPGRRRALSALFWALLCCSRASAGVPRSVVILYPILGAALVVGEPPGGRLAAQERLASSCPCACASTRRATC